MAAPGGIEASNSRLSGTDELRLKNGYNLRLSVPPRRAPNPHQISGASTPRGEWHLWGVSPAVCPGRLLPLRRAAPTSVEFYVHYELKPYVPPLTVVTEAARAQRAGPAGPPRARGEARASLNYTATGAIRTTRSRTPHTARNSANRDRPFRCRNREPAVRTASRQREPRHPPVPIPTHSPILYTFTSRCPSPFPPAIARSWAVPQSAARVI